MKDFFAKSYKINNSYDYIKNYIRFYNEKNSIICYDNDINHTYYFSNFKQKNNLTNFIKIRNEAKKYSFGYYKLSNDILTEEIYTVFLKIHNKSIKNKNINLIFVGMGKIQSPELFFVKKVIDHKEISELAFYLEKDNLFFENILKDNVFLINYLTQWSRQNGIFLFPNNEYYSYELISVNRNEDMVQYIENNSYILSNKNYHYKKYLYHENFQKIPNVKFLYKEEKSMENSKKTKKNKIESVEYLNANQLDNIEKLIKKLRKRLVMIILFAILLIFGFPRIFPSIELFEKAQYVFSIATMCIGMFAENLRTFFKERNKLEISQWYNERILGLSSYKKLKSVELDKYVRENCRTQLIRQKEIFSQLNQTKDVESIILRLRELQDKITNSEYGKAIYMDPKLKVKKQKLFSILNNEEKLLYEVNILTKIALNYSLTLELDDLENYLIKLNQFETKFQARNQLLYMK